MHVSKSGWRAKLNKVFYDQIVTISGSDVHGSITFIVGLLVHVLTLSNHHTDHVQIAIFAGFPNIYNVKNKKVRNLKGLYTTYDQMPS